MLTFDVFQRLAFLRVTAHIVVALLLGLVYYDFGNDGAKVSSNFSCIFFIVIFNFYGTAMHTVLTCKYFYISIKIVLFTFKSIHIHILLTFDFLNHFILKYFN